MAHVFELVHVVIAAAIHTLGKRVKDGVAGLRPGFDDFQNAAHRNAAPLCNARPALDAKVTGYLFLFWHRFEFGESKNRRLLDQSVDAQSVIREIAAGQHLELSRTRHSAVWPEMGGDVV